MSRRRSESTAPSLRDLLQTRYPTRNVACPQCRRIVEAPRRAMTLRCPFCTAPLQLQDALVSRPVVGTVTTLGTVKVTRRGCVRGRVDCSSLLVDGVVDGRATVRGRTIVSSRGRVEGDLVTRGLIVARGGAMNADVVIGEPPKKLDAANEPPVTAVERLRARTIRRSA